MCARYEDNTRAKVKAAEVKVEKAKAKTTEEITAAKMTFSVEMALGQHGQMGWARHQPAIVAWRGGGGAFFKGTSPLL